MEQLERGNGVQWSFHHMMNLSRELLDHLYILTSGRELKLVLSQRFGTRQTIDMIYISL